MVTGSGRRAAASREGHAALRRVERQQALIEILHARRGSPAIQIAALAETLGVSSRTIARIGGEPYLAYYTEPYYEDKQTWVTAKIVTEHAGKVYSLALNAVADELADARPAFFAWASSLQWLS